MKLRKDGRKKAFFRELSMNEKLREERELDCETSIGSQKLATFPATVGFFAFSPSGEKSEKGESKSATYLTIALRNYGKQVSCAS